MEAVLIAKREVIVPGVSWVDRRNWERDVSRAYCS